MSVIEPLSLGKPAAPSQQSLLALSWLNFFLAGMQTAFGPIAAAYLAAREWTAMIRLCLALRRSALRLPVHVQQRKLAVMAPVRRRHPCPANLSSCNPLYCHRYSRDCLSFFLLEKQNDHSRI